MENVVGMRSVKGRNVALDVAAEMAACGYRVGYALLNAQRGLVRRSAVQGAPVLHRASQRSRYPSPCTPAKPQGSAPAPGSEAATNRPHQALRASGRPSTASRARTPSSEAAPNRRGIGTFGFVVALGILPCG